MLTNVALSGYLPVSIRPYFCGGRLVPINKKDAGIRPLVVGECLRAIIAKTAMHEHAGDIAELQPLQVGVGGRGPPIQAAVLLWAFMG